MVCVPYYWGVHAEVADCLIRILAHSPGKYLTQFSFRRESDISSSRNGIVREFLKTENDFLLMMDSDNPCPKNPADLIELNKEVVYLPTPINMGKKNATRIHFNVYDKDSKPLPPGNGLERVYKGGTGCVLVRRDVLEKIKKPFEAGYDKDGVLESGEDFMFSKKCELEGIEMWAAWDYVCRHYKEIDLLDILNGL